MSHRAALLDWLACAYGGRGQRAPRAARAAGARSLAAERVRLTTDESLRQAEAIVALDGEVVAHVPASRGSPEAPMDADELAAKCALLAGNRLEGVLDDGDAPAQVLLDALA